MYTYEILQEHLQTLCKDDQMIKMNTGSKFKMVVAAILKTVKWPQLYHF